MRAAVVTPRTDEAAVVALAREAIALGGWPALPATDSDAPTWVAWACAMGALPAPASGGIETFCREAGKAHQIQLDVAYVRECLIEQTGADQLLERWVLVASDGWRFWLIDPSVAPRLRLVALELDYDHRPQKDEVQSLAALIGRALLHRMSTEHAPNALPASPPRA